MYIIKEHITSKVFALLIKESGNYYFSITIQLTYLLVAILGQRQGAKESGNLVEYRECTFTENSAMQYGGAIAMLITASSLIFGDRENFISVEINSW